MINKEFEACYILVQNGETVENAQKKLKIQLGDKPTKQLQAYEQFLKMNKAEYDFSGSNDEFDEHLSFLINGKTNEKNKWILTELFNRNFQLEKFNEATVYLEKALALDKEFLPALLDRALHLFDPEMNCTEIILDLTHVIQFVKTENYIFSLLGQALYNCHNTELAKQFLQTSIALKKSTDALYLLGFIEHENKNFNRAKRYYLQALALENCDEIVCNELAWLFFDMGELKKSERIWKNLIQCDNSIQENYNPIIRYYIV